MAWVTWRQHRPQALTALGTLLVLAAAAVATAVPVRAAFNRHPLAACLPPSARAGCDIIVRHFQGEFATGVDSLRALVIVPALVGVFVGAPLLAREFEHGTYRFAWTQAITRPRWLLWKTLLLTAGTVAAAGALSAVTTWWRAPFDQFDARIAPAAFDVEGLVVPAYAVFALAVGVLAGLLLRRTVAAMTATLAVFVATRFAVAHFLRPRYLPPLRDVGIGDDSVAHTRDWVLSAPLVDQSGQQITTAREDLAILHAQHAGLDPHEYLAQLGWQRLVTYQPAGRFWSFQLIEAGIFVALAAAVVGAAVWTIRRVPA
ncbi:MAG TPA: hypothetical protein VE982_03475 [Gaiellaceae bacterium]|nr:hypothetical protein [Gaiellaceae bacterium]